MTENWQPIIGYEDLYEASNLGNIKSIPRERTPKGERVLKPAPTSKGYLTVNLYSGVSPKVSKSFLVHRLVAQAFHKNPNNYRYVCHKDGDKLNNQSENLYWGTAQMNEADKVRHGTNTIGSRNPKAKMTEDDVLEIRKLNKNKMSNRAIAEKYGISPTTVSHIKKRQIWKHI